MNGRSSTDLLGNALLRLMAASFNHRPAIRVYLKGNGGWVDSTIGFRTPDGSVKEAIAFSGGKARVMRDIPGDADVTMVFASDAQVREMLKATPADLLNMLLKSKLMLDGNLSYANLFNFYISLLMGKQHRRMMEKQKRRDREERLREHPEVNAALSGELRRRRQERMRGERPTPA